jgi:hypothetical protein
MATNSVTRRAVFQVSASLAAFPGLAASRKLEPENVYRFVTTEYEIRMSLEFYDRYASRELRFEERSSARRFCYSGAGEENRKCVKSFEGSVAIAHYRILSRHGSVAPLSIREYVRNIDRSESTPERLPFERLIETQGGVASDIQAFGFEQLPGQGSGRAPNEDEAWCLIRQDLFLKGRTTPFLVVHWKHTLSAIRVLDLIPGTGTVQVL